MNDGVCAIFKHYAYSVSLPCILHTMHTITLLTEIPHGSYRHSRVPIHPNSIAFGKAPRRGVGNMYDSGVCPIDINAPCNTWSLGYHLQSKGIVKEIRGCILCLPKLTTTNGEDGIWHLDKRFVALDGKASLPHSMHIILGSFMYFFHSCSACVACEKIKIIHCFEGKVHCRASSNCT